MTDNNLTITFTVDRTPDEVFAGITDVRASAWHFYVATSLRSLIIDGSGQPNPKEDDPS